ncbi:ABC transporter substrate-binding protein, partial [Acidisphaera sp. L21]|uniref:substrate-binding periplasmic protein n=1 Tax=Acidisphaera sp. L21 TaxID=1641851 RepID=UPI001C206966
MMTSVATMRRRIATALVGLCLTAGSAMSADLPPPPAPGASPRVDAIRKSGTLRVGVLSNPPWLVENTTGSGEAWAGPAWVLAQDYAKALGVKLAPIPVSHETKVPVLASNQVDMTISPLSVTPEREKVVDFVTYSSTSLCMIGRADNPKLRDAKSIDDLDKPDVTIAYFTGGGEENWVKKRFPHATLRGVSTAGTAVPLEELMGRRADVSPINRVPWVALNRKVKGLAALPRENNCQDSKEQATDIGSAIDKNQTVFLDWLRAMTTALHPQVQADELRIIG